MTPTEQYRERWRSCTACQLYKGASKHVLYRGSIPADLMFIGEAPGKVENTLGKPFVGPSGQLLNQALIDIGVLRYVICNTVCCIPWADDAHTQVRKPSDGEVLACNSHIHELIQLAKPKLIITLGEVAKKLLKGISLQGERGHLRHPAYVLRNGGVGSLEYKRFIMGLQDACKKFKIPHVPTIKPVRFAEEVRNNES